MPSAPPKDATEASRLDLLALALLAGSLLTIVGVSVSAASAPKIGVVDTWGRIDDIASRVARWEYVVLVAAVGGIVALFERTGSTLDGTGSGVDYYTSGEMIGETVVSLCIAVATVGVAVFARRSMSFADREAS